VYSMKKFSIIIVPPQGEAVRTVIECDRIEQDGQTISAYVANGSDHANRALHNDMHMNYRDQSWWIVVARISLGEGQSAIIEPHTP